MVYQKRWYFIGAGVFFSLFLFLILLSSVHAVCYRSNTICYTADERRSGSDQPLENQVCHFSPPDRFSCNVENTGYCCSTSGGNLGLHGFLVNNRKDANVLRMKYAVGEFKDQQQLQCSAGTLSGSGLCQFKDSPLLQIDQPKTYELQRGRDDIFCDQNEVVCGSSSSPRLVCCTVAGGATVDSSNTREIQFPEIRQDFDINQGKDDVDGEGRPIFVIERDTLALCSAGYALCGKLNFGSSAQCCKVSGVSIDNATDGRLWNISGGMHGKNTFCSPFELPCGALYSTREVYRIRDGAVDELNDRETTFQNLACCEAFHCQPEPDCSVPGRDNDCNGSSDGLDPVCADTDLDRVKDADDQCADTPVGERADATGCSLSQKDSDEDGVSDRDDLCPNQKGATMEDFARTLDVCIAEAREACLEKEPLLRQGCLSKSRSDCEERWKPDDCPSAVAETREACDARRGDGLVWLGSDQGGACCGDGDGEYFILQNKACVGSTPLQSGYSGGGFGVGRHFLSDLRSPGVKGNAEAFLTITERSQILGLDEKSPVMEDEEAPSNFIAIQKNHSHNRYLNQYSLEYAVEVDASKDTNTQLHLTLLDDQNTPVYRKTVPGTHIFPNGQRTIQDTFEFAQGTALQISVRKSGAGTVKIGSLALYHLGDRQIFFTGQDFLFCRNPEANQLLEGGRLAFERTTPQQGPLTNENNARSACAGALESGFVCDTDGQWRDKGALPHINKSLPSEAELRDVGITLAFNRADQPNVRQTGCCLPDYCWDGGQCVPASNADSMLGLREIQANPADQEPRNLFVCSLDESGSANWLPGQRKYDQYLATSSFCASEQCWFNGERQDPPSPSQCVESGEKNDQEGIFCDNGAWKTRLTALVESMIDVNDRNAGNPGQFSLYCDDLSKVVLDQEGKTAFWDRKIDTIFTGKEKACILAYNHATWRSTSLAGFLLSQLFEREQRNIIIGVLLDGEDRVTDEIASKNGPQQNFCGGAKQSPATNNFVGCAGPSRTSDFARLFFNKDLNAVIFSGYADISVRIEGGG